MEWKRMIKIGYWWLFHILIFAAAALLFWDACKVRLDADPDARIWKQEQAAHVGQYEETIQGVIDQADQMSVISIFSREGSFSKSNIEKTREDALRLQGVDPQILSSPFAQYWLSWDLSDFLIPVLLFLAVLLFQQERREGMWELVRLTGKGRGGLLFRRLGLLAVLACADTLVLYGLRFLICLGMFGGFSQWGAPLQSLPDFSLSALPFTLGEFAVFLLVMKSLGYTAAAWMFYGIFSLFRERRFASLALGALLLAELLARYLILASSRFHILSWCNVFAILDPYWYGSVYQNLNLFGRAVGGIWVTVSALAGIAGGSVLLLGVLQAVQYPHAQRWRITQKLEQWAEKWKGRRKPASCFRMEGRKLFLYQKGLILLLVLGLIQSYRVERLPQFSSRQEAFRLAYFEMFEGPITEEDLEAAQEEGKEIESYIMEAQGAAVESYVDQKNALDMVYAEMERVWEVRKTGADAWLLEPTGYGKLMKGGMDVLGDMALCGGWILLLSVGAWYREKKDGMPVLMHLTDKGRGYVQRQKVIWIGLYALLAFGMIFGVSAGNILYRFPITGLTASVKSLPWLSEYAGPIWLYVGGYYMLLFAILCVVWGVGILVGYRRYCLKKI